MNLNKENFWAFKRSRDRVLEIQFMPRADQGKLHYEYYISYLNQLIPLPNRTDFNADEDGQILELWEQRTQDNWRASLLR